MGTSEGPGKGRGRNGLTILTKMYKDVQFSVKCGAGLHMAKMIRQGKATLFIQHF